MGNCFSSPSVSSSLPKEKKPKWRKYANVQCQVDGWVSNLRVLCKAQKDTQTKLGQKIMKPSTIMLSNQEVEMIRDDAGASSDVRLIMNPPFSEVSRITDKLFLSGVAGLTTDNVANLNISLIVNVTYEMPILIRPKLASVRVPVDDDPLDDIHRYLDDISYIIHRASLEGLRSIVHCVAGASRSATVVIAYLIRHQNYSLKEAFCYVHACRQCARPNMGFFKQLLTFESSIRQCSSVQMVEYVINGGKVRVPDFYKTEYPELFLTEAQKQLRQPFESVGKESKNTFATAKGKMSANMLTHDGVKKQAKLYLKEAYDEINEIRIRSCASKN